MRGSHRDSEFKLVIVNSKIIYTVLQIQERVTSNLSSVPDGGRHGGKFKKQISSTVKCPGLSSLSIPLTAIFTPVGNIKVCLHCGIYKKIKPVYLYAIMILKRQI